MTLGELVERLGGKLVQGSADASIDGVNSTVQAAPEHLVFAQDAASATDAIRRDAGAVIGCGVRIGADCHIYPRAVLYPGTMLGDRVVVHAGAVLGSDGFG